MKVDLATIRRRTFNWRRAVVFLPITLLVMASFSVWLILTWFVILAAWTIYSWRDVYGSAFRSAKRLVDPNSHW